MGGLEWLGSTAGLGGKKSLWILNQRAGGADETLPLPRLTRQGRIFRIRAWTAPRLRSRIGVCPFSDLLSSEWRAVGDPYLLTIIT